MVECYLRLYQQHLNLKVIEMYNAKFIRSISYATEDTKIFITSRISAEMTKHLVYIVDLCLDSNGVIEEAQCECAAGSGPNAHCKHVALTFYALTKWQDVITTMDTCTQKLQTFHQAKSYSGSPIKMYDIQLRSEGPICDLSSFDPRPVEYRNSPEYPAQFRNGCLNVTDNSRLPIFQLFECANMYALNVDHDYLPLSLAEQFLQNFYITKTDEQQRT